MQKLMVTSTLDEADQVGFEFELFSTCFWDVLGEDCRSASISQNLVRRQ